MNTELNDFSRVQIHQAGSDDVGRRLDNFLINLLKGVPRSRIYRILRKGEVRVNKGRVAAAYRISSGDLIRIPPVRMAERDAPVQPPTPVLQRLEQRILHEDKELLVINKPAGLAVHGGSGLNFGLIEAMRTLRPHDQSLELVHRLDRDTSGCLLLAKKRSGLRELHELMREGRVEKRYLALLAGRWRRDNQLVDMPLLKNGISGGERIVRVDPRGKPARTHFSVIRRWPGYMLVEVLLETGRTHQIRVHAAHLGTPICGDDKYGDAEVNERLKPLGLKRLFLHAIGIAFQRPSTTRRQEFSAPLDEELDQVLQRLE